MTSPMNTTVPASYHAQLLPLDFFPGANRSSVQATFWSPAVLRATALLGLTAVLLVIGSTAGDGVGTGWTTLIGATPLGLVLRGGA